MNEFEKWLETKDGKKCLDESILRYGQQEYLKNRLWWAFDAGKNVENRDSEVIELLNTIRKRELPKNLIARIDRILNQVK